MMRTYAQVRSVLGQVRPDRQTLLFSATMPHKVRTRSHHYVTRVNVSMCCVPWAHSPPLHDPATHPSICKG